MYTLDKIKLNIIKLINKALKKKLVQASDLVFPPNSNFGDLSLPCFELAKKLNKTATETEEWLVSEIEVDDVIVATKAIGPYLNFTCNKAYLAKSVIEQIQQEGNEYGRNKTGKNKKVMIEYSNVNTHKEYHVGHLRNICYGDSVVKILSANGFKTIPVSYVNDFGIHVAKTLWCYQKFYKSSYAPTDSVQLADLVGKKDSEDKGQFLGKVYTRACKELEKNPTAKELVTFLMKKIESRKGAEYKLWQKTRKWNIDQFNKIYKELGVKFDHIFYESEFIDKGRKIVEDLYAEHFLTKSQGAIIVNLEKYDLGVLLFLRSDGSALYPVADLPLAIEKFKKHKLDKSIYVVDVRQGLYFKQLFKVLELLFTKDTKCLIGHLVSEMPELVHLGYEFVKLPSGMMSSRTGQVITYEDLREQAMKKAIHETKKRHKNWSAKKVEQVANTIVNGAIKFEMIKV
ncbi:arginine--tRNA ligase, partial [Candidatus Parcubacteria bacterium]|nr:arginine--tRNA ligase [Candidatus Parcubacteria bacterium]